MVAGMTIATEPTTCRRVFPTWSIEIPDHFQETFIFEGAGYWHAYDPIRSVSMSSVLLTDRGRPVSAARIVRQVRGIAPPGELVSERPTDDPGWAVIAVADPGARASRLLSGAVAIDGCILLVTITADDLEWLRSTWMSIRVHPRDH